MRYFQIGTSVGTLRDIGELVGTTFPEWDFIPWGNSYTGSDGLTYGDGAASASWTFPLATLVELTKLRGYLLSSGVYQKSAAVYIRTCNDLGDWRVYTAMMHWPTNPAQYKKPGGMYAGFPVTFTNLTDVTP